MAQIAIWNLTKFLKSIKKLMLKVDLRLSSTATVGLLVVVVIDTITGSYSTGYAMQLNLWVIDVVNDKLIGGSKIS